jgi:hypothetical protein
MNARGRGRGRETPQPFQYCAVCKRNHQHGRGHVFTKAHQAALGKLLDKATAKMEQVIQQLAVPLMAVCKPGWCIFCQGEIKVPAQEGADAVYVLLILALMAYQVSLLRDRRVQHLASSTHHKAVDKFWGEYGVEAYWKASGKPRLGKEKFKITQAEWNKVCVSCALSSMVLIISPT